jgi:hypothetical protein
MSRVLTILLLMVSTSSIAAQQCEQPDQNVAVEYGYSMSTADKAMAVTHRLTVWRLDKHVAHQYLATGITDVWQQVSNGDVRLIRYFDNDQQAIEYQPGEVRVNNIKQHWQEMTQMVSENQLHDMTLINQTGSGCDRVETYQYQDHYRRLVIKWLPEYHLMTSSTDTAAGKVSHWEILSFHHDLLKITEAFESRDRYLSTDYADIGDNETNPFLIKMINLGYVSHAHSGFYNTEGHDMGDSHDH